jgi:hypothetical protein
MHAKTRFTCERVQLHQRTTTIPLPTHVPIINASLISAIRESECPHGLDAHRRPPHDALIASNVVLLQTVGSQRSL